MFTPHGFQLVLTGLTPRTHCLACQSHCQAHYLGGSRTDPWQKGQYLRETELAKDKLPQPTGIELTALPIPPHTNPPKREGEKS